VPDGAAIKSGTGVNVVMTVPGWPCQQSQFAENRVRHSRRMRRYCLAGSLVSHEWAVM
jgi:hypothetical protein